MSEIRNMSTTTIDDAIDSLLRGICKNWWMTRENVERAEAVLLLVQAKKIADGQQDTPVQDPFEALRLIHETCEANGENEECSDHCPIMDWCDQVYNDNKSPEEWVLPNPDQEPHMEEETEEGKANMSQTARRWWQR